jgi:RHS repeat-associated protein
MIYPIDNLVYGYAPTSNRLLSVYDQSQSFDGFKDGIVNDNDYEYDAYGNMILDRNKNIESITYNHLNLPTEIDFGDSGIIYYIYNALGVKVAKKVSAPEVQDETDYLSGFQYKNGELQFFPTAEGYVNVTDGRKFNYVYNYTDHLGNIRLSYTFDGRENELKILEENHYYPFGLKHSNYNVNIADFDEDETGVFAIFKSVERNKNQYKYNGKEFQDELNLNWYDYHARNYDPAIGRWMNIDPLADTYPDLTPYRYAFNNPLVFIDPNGMLETDFYSREGEFLGHDGVDNGQVYLLNEGVRAKTEVCDKFNWGGQLSDSVSQQLRDNSTEVGGLIIQNRTEEGSDYTISEFKTVGGENNVEGFMLEPGGPSTATANQDQRIPEGVYDVDNYSSTKYPDNFILSNADVSKSRLILYHSGNYPSNTEGCNMPGTTKSSGSVGGSKAKLNELRTFINSEGASNVKTIINNKIP